MGFVRREGAQVSEALGAWQGREVSFQGSEPLCVLAYFIPLSHLLHFSLVRQTR